MTNTFARMLGFALCLGSMLCTSMTSLHGQSTLSQSSESNRGIFSAGPSVTLGQAYQVGTLAAGWTSSPQLSWSLGALGDYLVTDGLSIDFECAFDVRNTYLSDTTARGTTNGTYRYLSLRPQLNLGSFLIGFGVGIPLGCTVLISNAISTQTATITSGDMDFLIEARAGLSIPVLQNDDGELRILLGGAYGFTRILKSSIGADHAVNNGPLATISAGVSYLFTLLSR